MIKSIGIMATVALLALTGCGGDEPGRGGLTAAEEQALDNAAAMLDENAIESAFGDGGDNAAMAPAGDEAGQ